jgi:hypothetical protein
VPDEAHNPEAADNKHCEEPVDHQQDDDEAFEEANHTLNEAQDQEAAANHHREEPEDHCRRTKLPSRNWRERARRRRRGRTREGAQPPARHHSGVWRQARLEERIRDNATAADPAMSAIGIGYRQQQRTRSEPSQPEKERGTRKGTEHTSTLSQNGYIISKTIQ